MCDICKFSFLLNFTLMLPNLCRSAFVSLVAVTLIPYVTYVFSTLKFFELILKFHLFSWDDVPVCDVSNDETARGGGLGLSTTLNSAHKFFRN